MFLWTPSYTQDGSYSVIFTATDNGSPNMSASKTITITVINVVGIVDMTPVRTELVSIAPNPFNTITTIRYDVAVERQVSLIVFNTMGQALRRFVADDLIATPRMVLAR